MFTANVFAADEDLSELISNPKLGSYSKILLSNFNQTATRGLVVHPSTDLPKMLFYKDGQIYMECFLEHNGSRYLTELENEGVIFHAKSYGLATCLVPILKISTILAKDNVLRLEAGHLARHMMDTVRRCSNILPLHEGVVYENSTDKDVQFFKGKDVIVGVVDEGFDFTHPNYYNNEGTEYRVSSIWVQGADSGTAPKGYSYGAEYDDEADILAVGTDNAEETHGTHTSGIAAGGGYKTSYTGVAPESDMILVATNMTTTGIVNGVSYILNKAKETGKPCVVNLSLGSQIGPHDGTGYADRMLDEMVGEGAIIVGAAGNSGESNIHIKKTFTKESKDSIATFLSLGDDFDGAAIVDIWSRELFEYDIIVSIYNSASGNYSATTGLIPVTNSTENLMLPTENNEYYLSISNSHYSYNNSYNCMIQVEPANVLSDEYITITVKMPDNTDYHGTINMWATDATFTDNDIAGYMSGNTTYTVGEIGGVGKEIISVGAYCTKNMWKSLSTDKEYTYDPVPVSYSIAPFSSLGPTADGRIKPDITAPGFGVVSGYNSFNSSYGEDCTTTVQKMEFNNKSYYWGIDQGTSMACPVVAGSVALWLSANPRLTPDDIRNILKTTSFEPTVTRSSVAELPKDNTWGWGKLNALSGITGVVPTFVENISVAGNDNFYNLSYSGNRCFNIETSSSISKIVVSDLSGRNIREINFSKEADEFSFDLEGINSGIYMLQIYSPDAYGASKIFVK